MPELPEIKRYALAINSASTPHTFHSLTILPSAKPVPLTTPIPPSFTLSATSRGKELLLTLTPTSSSSSPPLTLRANHGLVGRWEVVSSPEQASDLPGARYVFASPEVCVVYVDTMNMGSLKQGSWSPGRSPCPSSQHTQWLAHVQAKVGAKRRLAVLDKPIADALLDQKLFNGVGNYLRAELMFRLRLDPSTPAGSILSDPPQLIALGNELAAIIDEVLDPSVVPSRNKYGSDDQIAAFESWLQVYNIGSFSKDGRGRKIWYDPSVQTQTSITTSSSSSSSSSTPSAVAASPGYTFIPPLPSTWQDLYPVYSTLPTLDARLTQDAQTKQIFPPRERVFDALHATPLSSVRVVVLGQDPYHDDGQAHGLSFSVEPSVRVPPSLANIYKELESDPDVAFAHPGHGCLIEWATRGVLLLNTVLTVVAHKANSHKKLGWEDLTRAAVELVANSASHVVFLAWGASAKKAFSRIDRDRHTVIETPHPSPLSASRGFFGSRCFSRTNAALIAHGSAPIDWQLSPPHAIRLDVDRQFFCPVDNDNDYDVDNVDDELASAMAALDLEGMERAATYTPHYTFDRVPGLDLLLSVMNETAEAKEEFSFRPTSPFSISPRSTSPASSVGSLSPPPRSTSPFSLGARPRSTSPTAMAPPSAFPKYQPKAATAVPASRPKLALQTALPPTASLSSAPATIAATTATTNTTNTTTTTTSSAFSVQYPAATTTYTSPTYTSPTYPSPTAYTSPTYSSLSQKHKPAFPTASTHGPSLTSPTSTSTSSSLSSYRAQSQAKFDALKTKYAPTATSPTAYSPTATSPTTVTSPTSTTSTAFPTSRSRSYSR